MSGTARTLSVLLVMTAALAWVYWPALGSTYFYHDDVNFFLTTPHQPYPKSYQLSLAIGRFIGAPVYALQGRLVDDITDLNKVRAIAFLQLLVCAGLLFRLLFRHGWPRAVAAVLATLAVTLPSFQVIVSLAGYAFQMTGVLLALLAVSFADAVPSNKPLRMGRSWAAWAALMLLFAAIATHPSTAMFYWAGAAAIFSRNSAPAAGIRRKALIVFGLGALTMAVYAAVLKLTRTLHPPADLGFYNPYDWNTDIAGKIKWFVTEPLPNALNLWNIFPRPVYAAAAALAWGAAGILALVRGRQHRSSVLLRGALLATALLLSFSTNLLAASNAPFYRCCIALSAIVLLIWFTAGLQLSGCLRPLLAGRLAIAAALLAAILALPAARLTLQHYRVNPSVAETRYIVDAMRDRNVFLFDRVHVTYPDRKQLRNRYDEFGGPTASFHGDLVGLVLTGIRAEAARQSYRVEHLEYDFREHRASLVLKDAAGRQSAFHVTITGAARSTPVHGSSPTLILDLPRLYSGSGPLSYLRKDN